MLFNYVVKNKLIIVNFQLISKSKNLVKDPNNNPSYERTSFGRDCY